MHTTWFKASFSWVVLDDFINAHASMVTGRGQGRDQSSWPVLNLAFILQIRMLASIFWILLLPHISWVCREGFLAFTFLIVFLSLCNTYHCLCSSRQTWPDYGFLRFSCIEHFLYQLSCLFPASLSHKSICLAVNAWRHVTSPLLSQSWSCHPSLLGVSHSQRAQRRQMKTTFISSRATNLSLALLITSYVQTVPI